MINTDDLPLKETPTHTIVIPTATREMHQLAYVMLGNFDTKHRLTIDGMPYRIISVNMVSPSENVHTSVAIELKRVYD